MWYWIELGFLPPLGPCPALKHTCLMVAVQYCLVDPHVLVEVRRAGVRLSWLPLLEPEGEEFPGSDGAEILTAGTTPTSPNAFSEPCMPGTAVLRLPVQGGHARALLGRAHLPIEVSI